MYIILCQNGKYSTMETKVAMMPKIMKVTAACRLAFTVRVGRREGRGWERGEREGKGRKERVGGGEKMLQGSKITT